MLPLPTEHLPTIEIRKIVRAALWVIVFVLISNVIAYFYLESYSPNWGYTVIKHKWDLLFRQQKPVDILILGDSSGNQALIPENIEKSTGKTALNLATVADLNTTDDAWMLGYYLKHVGVPKQVILIHVYDSWNRKTNQAPYAQMPMEVIRKEQLSPATASGLSVLAKESLYKYIPFYAQRHSLMTRLKQPWNLFEKAFNFEFESDGFMAEHSGNPEKTAADLNHHLNSVINGKIAVSNDNKKALSAINKIAEQYGFDVHIFNSPVYGPLQKSDEFQAFYRSMTDSLQTTLTALPRLTYRSSDYIYQAAFDQYSGVDHVSREGAVGFTHFVMNELTKPSVD